MNEEIDSEKRVKLFLIILAIALNILVIFSFRFLWNGAFHSILHEIYSFSLKYSIHSIMIFIPRPLSITTLILFIRALEVTKKTDRFRRRKEN